MEFLSHPVTQEVIEKGFSYSEFVQLTQQLVEEKRTTGANQSLFGVHTDVSSANEPLE